MKDFDDPGPGLVRCRLNRATRGLHDALHRHPLLSRLLESDLTFPELRATAEVSRRAISAVEAERARLDLWQDLSLAEHAAELSRVLGFAPAGSTEVRLPWPVCVPSLLGALYVVYGSAFGSAVLSRTVREIFPNAPRSFFLPSNAEKWRGLCARLEALTRQEIDLAEDGAVAMFAYYGSLADEASEALGTLPVSDAGRPAET